jgi:outer membrane lipoprotein-sorting protein
MKTVMQFGILLLSLFVIPAWMHGAELTAVQILDKVDGVVNAPKDQRMEMKLLLIDKNGGEKVREISMMQQGSDRRVGKFLSPADQKGIGFLSLPNGLMYIYLPAYKKTRRIASHVKNNKFAGTDFTYEDMEAKRYSEKWNAELVEEEDGSFVLELRPKPGTETEYSKMVMWIEKDNFFPTRIEYYNKGEKLSKIMTQEKIEAAGGYLIARESEMKDLASGHRTKMILTEVEFDTGIGDDKFTERYLAK